LNRDFDYGAVTDNQLRNAQTAIGYFSTDIGAATQISGVSGDRRYETRRLPRRRAGVSGG